MRILWTIAFGIILVAALWTLVARVGTNETTLSEVDDLYVLTDIHGNEVAESDFHGKIQVVNTWATWCPFCVDELPDFVRLQEAFPEEIVVVAVNRAESRERTLAFTDELEVTDGLVYLLDPSDSFYRSIGAFSMPETIFLDREGEIVFHKRGPMPFEEMEAKIQELL